MEEQLQKLRVLYDAKLIDSYRYAQESYKLYGFEDDPKRNLAFEKYVLGCPSF